MRELMLFRHAKSDWSVEGIPDHQRQLNGRGRMAAPAMAQHIFELGLMPDEILCSTAVRTRQTLDLMSAKWQELAPEWPAKIGFEDHLYEASPMAIMACIGNVDDRSNRLMVIGHNPGLEDLADYLLQGQSSELQSAMSAKFPTAALALLEISTNTWASLAGSSVRLTQFIQPADIR